jgi:transcriptional regulator with XRE-family HTH domain
VNAFTTLALFTMEFPERLAALRKARGLTQQALADLVFVTVLQIHRYESGSSQPTLDVIRRLAIALGVSADVLIFDAQERGPSEALRYQFETLSRMAEHEQEIAREVIDALIIKSQVSGALDRVRPAIKEGNKPRAQGETDTKQS